MNTGNLVGLALITTISAAFSAPAATYDFLESNALQHFQSTTRWQRVAEVAAVEGQKEVTASGQGSILFNGSGKDKSIPYLFTRESFGDVRVELEFMIPQGSNAGVYLMGRYETQILDSYGKERVGSGDLGGIYQRWDRSLPKDQQWSEGTRPKVNAAKAPGSWQTMEIVFRAPRFDATGKKNQDATFESVHINGIQVQENATSSGPTASNPLPGEASSGPIVIQGDHGPIAIRRFQATPLPSPATTALKEINAFWAEVSRSVHAGDFAAYQATCHEQGVIISGSKQTSYPLQQALARWQPDFTQTQSGAVNASVEFRFAHRYRDAQTAHESGIFCYTSQKKGGEPTSDFIVFEALLSKQSGSWKMLMEYQKAPTDQAAWDALPPQP